MGLREPLHANRSIPAVVDDLNLGGEQHLEMLHEMMRVTDVHKHHPNVPGAALFTVDAALAGGINLDDDIGVGYSVAALAAPVAGTYNIDIKPPTTPAHLHWWVTSHWFCIARVAGAASTFAARLSLMRAADNALLQVLGNFIPGNNQINHLPFVSPYPLDSRYFLRLQLIMAGVPAADAIDLTVMVHRRQLRGRIYGA